MLGLRIGTAGIVRSFLDLGDGGVVLQEMGMEQSWMSWLVEVGKEGVL